MAGQKKARMPKAMAAMPRSRTSHQLAASSCSNARGEIGPDCVRVLVIGFLLQANAAVSYLDIGRSPVEPALGSQLFSIYWAYWNSGLAFRASFVAPGRTNFLSISLS